MNLIIFNWIHSFAGRSHTFDSVGYFFADILTYLLVFGGIYFLWKLRGWRQRIFGALEICLAVLISRGVITEIIRHFYAHPRPFQALGFTPLLTGENPWNSFPSGHMTALFAFVTILFFLNKKWGVWYAMLSLAVGIGRIYVGVHWPLDILGGMVIGILSGIFVHWLVRKHWMELETGAAEISGTVS